MARTPTEKKLFNQSLIMNPVKYSDPTKDNNVFNAANLDIRAGKRIADQSNDDDQSNGYKTPIMFGDYVDYLMKMRNEGVELDDADEALLDEIADLSEDDFTELMLEEIDIQIKDDGKAKVKKDDDEGSDEEDDSDDEGEEDDDEGSEEGEDDSDDKPIQPAVKKSAFKESFDHKWLNSLYEEKLNKIKGF